MSPVSSVIVNIFHLAGNKTERQFKIALCTFNNTSNNLIEDAVVVRSRISADTYAVKYSLS